MPACQHQRKLYRCGLPAPPQLLILCWCRCLPASTTQISAGAGCLVHVPAYQLCRCGLLARLPNSSNSILVRVPACQGLLARGSPNSNSVRVPASQHQRKLCRSGLARTGSTFDSMPAPAKAPPVRAARTAPTSKSSNLLIPCWCRCLPASTSKRSAGAGCLPATLQLPILCCRSLFSAPPPCRRLVGRGRRRRTQWRTIRHSSSCGPR